MLVFCVTRALGLLFPMMGSTVGGVSDSHILDVWNLMELLDTQVKMSGTALASQEVGCGLDWRSVALGGPTEGHEPDSGGHGEGVEGAVA